MRKYLVIGNPIEHSLSPKLHNYWIKNNNINAIYEKQKLEKDEIESLILKVKEKKLHGINITVPFKKAVIPFLDKLSLEAEKTQSVNTIYLYNNKIIGHNTDIDGFEFVLKNLKFNLNKKKVFILGAGGVVPSIIFALNKMNVSLITISNRTRDKANDMKNLFKDLNVVDWGNVPEFDMIINATSIGLNKDDKINLDLTKIGKNKFFYDVIYNPKETNFLKTGKTLGNRVENGKMMFIYQASASFKIWHEVEPEVNKEVIKLLDR
ncbi:shikimate dehydrogenase [Candidatus Pelagibacter bacterium]|nr:shikimate dehydrogenase [Candidatus Pelagibacter bacterium]|tara:strand:- start:341 stop:1135 length:795 start_codon:yes stop_codon:yes gene_type:complete